MTRSNILHKRYCFEVYDDVTYSCPFHIPHQTLSIHLNKNKKRRVNAIVRAYKGLNIMIQCISFLRCELNSTLNKVYYTQQNYLIIFFSFQPLHNRNFLILFFENRCLRNEWMNEDVLLATVFMAANLSKTHLSFLENCPRSWNSFIW